MAIYFREPFYYVYVTYVFCNFCLSLIDFIHFVDTTVSSRHNHHHAFVNLDLIHHFISPHGKCWSGEVVFTIFTHYECCIRPGTGDSSPHTENGVPAHTAHQIGAPQFQLQKILFITSQKCRDGQQTLISCTSFQILHLQLAVLFQTKSPMSTFSVSGDRILSHIMPRSADDDTVYLH